jgi:hypothetical protein
MSRKKSSPNLAARVSFLDIPLHRTNPDIEVPHSTLQCTFPSFSAKSVYPSVNLPTEARLIEYREGVTVNPVALTSVKTLPRLTNFCE